MSPAFSSATRLTPLVYVPEGEGVAYEWSWCPVPTNSENGFACPIDQAGLDRISTAVGLTDVPPLALGSDETVQFRNPFPPALLASLCAGDSGTTGLFVGQAGVGKSSRTYSCGVATLPVQIMLTIRGSTTDTGVISLRLPIDESTPANQNPLLTGVSVIEPQPQRPLDEAGLVTVPRDTKVTLLAGLAPSQAETYLDWQLGPDGQYAKDSTGKEILGLVTERLTVSWFAEGGGFENRTTSWSASVLDEEGQPFPFQQAIENDWSTPETSDYGKAMSVVMVVVRDNRGGVTWTRGQARLEDAP